jgi:hypothetical protein
MIVDLKNTIQGALTKANLPLDGIALESFERELSPLSKYEDMDFNALEKIHLALNSYVSHMSKGNCRGLVISGPAGSGKSSSVIHALDQQEMKKYKCISGALSPLRIYMELYLHRGPGEILILDDVDSVFQSLEGVNVMKAATDSIPQRRISWLTASPFLRAWGVPNTFNYDGSIILISNEFLATRKSAKFNNHLKALADRMHHLSMGSLDKDEQFHLLCFYVAKRRLLKSRGLNPAQEQAVLDYISEHFDEMTSITLRAATKIAELILLEPEHWRSMAALSVLTKPHEYF